MILAKLKKKIKIELFKFQKLKDELSFKFYKGKKKVDLLLFDDIFPHPSSGFRYEEFTVLLAEVVESKIIMTSHAYPVIKTPLKNHKVHVSDYGMLNKHLRYKLVFRKGFVNVNAKLFYCVFINNIYNNLNWLERYQIPFIFTLYPGGGFVVEDELCDSKLEKVLKSKMFRKVIVTQKFTRDYLIKKNFCGLSDIEFIFGGVVPQLSLKKITTNKKKYLFEKTTFDICFCAAKYTARGEDKGYDVFIAFVKEIASKYDFIRFHVIGGFSPNDIDVSMISQKIKFYGYMNFDQLGSIFTNIDVLISPNKPFILGNGAFDGFPLGTAVEAVLNGVVVLISDELNQNSHFIRNEEIIIIDNNYKLIEKEVINLINHPEKLHSISKKAKEKFIKVYSNEMQMKPRIKLLLQEIEKN